MLKLSKRKIKVKVKKLINFRYVFLPQEIVVPGDACDRDSGKIDLKSTGTSFWHSLAKMWLSGA